MLRLLLLMLVAFTVCGCDTSGIESASGYGGFWKALFDNLDVILSNSGIAGVILLFWFIDRVWTNRLIGKLNDTVTRAINNNTAAMSGLTATLQTGCPAVRSRAGETQGGSSGNPQTVDRGGGGGGL